MDKVLCLIEYKWINEEVDEQWLWMDLEPHHRQSRRVELVFPLINHPHNDIENGQEETHYHIDFRYPMSPPTYSRVDLPLKHNQKLEYRMLSKIKDKHSHITHINLISKSKLKHKCIHKGKCPHRGYDLSNEIPDENGIITCPLHGLKFDTKDNNKIINHK